MEVEEESKGKAGEERVNDEGDMLDHCTCSCTYMFLHSHMFAFPCSLPRLLLCLLSFHLLLQYSLSLEQASLSCV